MSFEQVLSYEALAPVLDAVLKQRIVANYAPDRESLEAEIAAGELWAQSLPEGLVLLHRANGPQRLRFLLTEADALCRLSLDRSTALELPFRKSDERLPALAQTLTANGWAEALRRVRLTRRAAPAPGDRSATAGCPGPEAAEELLPLLRSCFSTLTGCLPSRAELEDDLRCGRLLALNGGLIRWREKGRGSEIRHLAVSPAQRGRGLAKALVADYLALEGEKLCRVWTGADNYTAQHVYQSFGYAEDGWTSIVLFCAKQELL